MRHIVLHGEKPSLKTTSFYEGIVPKVIYGIPLTKEKLEDILICYLDNDIDINPIADQRALNEALNYASSAPNILRDILATQFNQRYFNPIEVAERLEQHAKDPNLYEYYQIASNEYAKLARQGYIGIGLAPIAYALKADVELSTLDLEKKLSEYPDLLEKIHSDPTVYLWSHLAGDRQYNFGINDNMTGGELRDLLEKNARKFGCLQEKGGRTTTGLNTSALVTELLVRLGVNSISYKEDVILLSDQALDLASPQHFPAIHPLFLADITTDPIIIMTGENVDDICSNYMWDYYEIMSDGCIDLVSLVDVEIDNPSRLAVVASLNKQDVDSLLKTIDWNTITPIKGQVCYEDVAVKIIAGSEDKNEVLLNLMNTNIYSHRFK